MDQLVNVGGPSKEEFDKVVEEIALKQSFYNAGKLSTSDLSTGIATAIKNAYNAGYITESNDTANIAFSLSNNVPYSIDVISYSGNTFYFIVYSYNGAWQGYVGINDTVCARLKEIAYTDQIGTLNSNIAKQQASTVTGTLPSSENTWGNTSLPTGYTSENSVIVGCSALNSNNLWYANASEISVYSQGSNVYFKSTASGFNSKSIKIVVMKIPT